MLVNDTQTESVDDDVGETGPALNPLEALLAAGGPVMSEEASSASGSATAASASLTANLALQLASSEGLVRESSLHREQEDHLCTMSAP